MAARPSRRAAGGGPGAPTAAVERRGLTAEAQMKPRISTLAIAMTTNTPRQPTTSAMRVPAGAPVIRAVSSPEVTTASHVARFAGGAALPTRA